MDQHPVHRGAKLVGVGHHGSGESGVEHSLGPTGLPGERAQHVAARDDADQLAGGVDDRRALAPGQLRIAPATAAEIGHGHGAGMVTTRRSMTSPTRTVNGSTPYSRVT